MAEGYEERMAVEWKGIQKLAGGVQFKKMVRTHYYLPLLSTGRLVLIYVRAGTKVMVPNF